MNRDDIITAINLLTDLTEVNTIIRAGKNHAQKLAEEGYKRALTETRERVGRWKPGMELWCCAEGTFLGGGIQRGDKVMVVRVHPRAKEWVALLKHPGKKKLQWWTLTGLHRYAFRTVKPAKAGPDKDERKMLEDVGKIITERM